jgi:single-stranded-DNA-specific exonuclease
MNSLAVNVNTNNTSLQTSSNFNYKKIQLRDQNSIRASEIQSLFSIKPFLSKVLASRKLSNNDIEVLLNPSLKNLPHISGVKDLLESCKYISDAVKQKLKIGITCDFDVDGLTGGSQLYALLKDAQSDVTIFVPDRFTEGYGLSGAIVDAIVNAKIELLITVDFGTKNSSEIAKLRQHGIKTIVIDHHAVAKDDNPGSDFFVNPKRPDCGFAEGALCASGLVWYLIAGLKKYLPFDYDPKEYLDLAAMGTICDMVPLQGVNRIIAKNGLLAIERRKRVGLRMLAKYCGLSEKIKCSDVSFMIGPRLNAAGRIEHGKIIVSLLTTQSETEADTISSRLNKLNTERQQEEQQMKNTLIKQLEMLPEIPSGIVVWSKEYHTGIIGIVAQRIVETYYRPTAVAGLEKEGIYKGSVRGIQGISVVLLLEKLQSYLIKFGGHDGAGGFSIEEKNLPSFKNAFNDECARLLTVDNKTPYCLSDIEISLSDLSPALVEEFGILAPFGIGNPTPLLLTRNLTVHTVTVLKNMHLKVLFTDGKYFLETMLWRSKDHPCLIQGKRVNLAYKIEKNYFQGTARLQGIIQAVEFSTNA